MQITTIEKQTIEVGWENLAECLSDHTIVQVNGWLSGWAFGYNFGWDIQDQGECSGGG